MDKVMGLGRTLAVAGGAVIGGVGAVMAVPSLLGAVGFTSAGITAGSSAASMMSAAATANGGGVAAGGLVSILQSAGAAGLPGTVNAAVACVGGIIGAGFVASLFQGEEQKKAKEKEKMTATAAAASDVDGAKVWWEERERKRREEEKMFMWDIAALAIAFCVVNWYLYTRADRGNRGHSNTKKRNQKVSAAVGL